MGLLDRFKRRAEAPERPKGIEATAPAGTVASAVSGRLVPMRDIPDPVFASGALGVCAAVWPEEDIVYSPVPGTVTAAMAHAVSIVTDDGLELMLHAGLDTVEMKGEGFELYCARGDRIEAGEALMSFNRSKVAKSGFKDIVICVVSNSDRYETVSVEAPRQVRAGEKIMEIGTRIDGEEPEQGQPSPEPTTEEE